MNERKAPPERVVDQKRFSPKNENMDGFPQFDLTRQVALVTGAARGLGGAISLALAHAGADVALGLRDASTGGALTSKIEALGRRVMPLASVVTRIDQVFSSLDETGAHLGTLCFLG